MNFISRKFHAVLDYSSALILILSPWLFNFADTTAAKLIMILAGVMVLLMSTMTRYEAGLIKAIPMAVHLTADMILGAFLIISPWLFGFSNEVFLPHLILGLLALFAGMFTVKRSYAGV